MELQAAVPIVERLYATVDTYKISHRARHAQGAPDPNLVYGEITGQTMVDVFEVTRPRPGETFCDLGSGTGKAVFLACLLEDFARGVGLELLGAMGAAARAVLARYDAEVRPGLSAAKQRQTIAFEDGDFLRADLTGMDVLYAHTTCFQPPLITSLTAKLKELKPGARVITIGMPLDVEPHLVAFHTRMVQMDFGRAPACVYLRTDEAFATDHA